MTVGTVYYAAPEQLMGGELDGRADQYALAATAFHLLSGSPPFQHSNPDGGHQPAPHRVAACPRRPASRVVGARSGAGQGALEGPQGPVQQLHGLRAGAGPPTGGRAGGRHRAHRSVAGACGGRPRGGARGTAAQAAAARRHRPCDLGGAAARGDRPGADPIPRDREAAERRLHTAVDDGRPRASGGVATSATTTPVDDDGHHVRVGGSRGRGRRRQLLAGRRHRHHRQRQHGLLLDPAVHRRRHLVGESRARFRPRR